MMDEKLYPIPLIDGGYALVSAEDHAYIISMKWRRKHGYARQAATTKTVLMHRIIMESMLGRQIVTDEVVDHIDRNRGNNRRDNLRLCTKAENARNGGLQVNNTTGWVGVTRHPQGPYVSYITVNAVRTYLGRFEDPAFGARVYDVAARHMHKQFATLNFPDEPNMPEAEAFYKHAQNYIGQKGSSSRYYGVSYKPKINAKRSWVARVGVGKVMHNLGYFLTEIEAAKAVDTFVKINGLKKKTNFPDEH